MNYHSMNYLIKSKVWSGRGSSVGSSKIVHNTTFHSINVIEGIIRSSRGVELTIIRVISGTSSDFVIKDTNLVNEHLDDVIKDNVFFISSGFFVHVVLSDNFSGGKSVV